MSRIAMWVLASVLALATAAHAQPADREAFAQDLMEEGDYFRAITVYKELAFAARSGEERARLHTLVGQGYRLSRRHDLALRALGLARREVQSEPLRDRIDLQTALVYLGLQLTPQARLALQRDMTAQVVPLQGLLRAVLDVDAGKVPEARAGLARVAVLAPGTRIAELAGEVTQALAAAEHAAHRSPGLAAAMSAFVPGAGQAYASHPVDGLQALLLVGALGTASYAAWRMESQDGGPYVWTTISLSVTALFHAANVVGAHRAARLFNLRATQESWGRARGRLLDLRF